MEKLGGDLTVENLAKILNIVTFNDPQRVHNARNFNVDGVVRYGSDLSVEGMVLYYDSIEQNKAILLPHTVDYNSVKHSDFVIGETIGFMWTLLTNFEIVRSFEDNQVYYQRVDYEPTLTSNKYIIIHDKDFLILVTKFNKTIPVISKLRLEHYYLDGNTGMIVADLCLLRKKQLDTYLEYILNIKLSSTEKSTISQIILDKNLSNLRKFQDLLEPLNSLFITESYETDLELWGKFLEEPSLENVQQLPLRDPVRKLDFWISVVRISYGFPVHNMFKDLKERAMLLKERSIKTHLKLPNKHRNLRTLVDVVLPSFKSPQLAEKIESLILKFNKGVNEPLVNLLESIIYNLLVIRDKDKLLDDVMKLLTSLQLEGTNSFWSDLQDYKLNLDFLYTLVNNDVAKQVIKNIDMLELLSMGIYRLLIKQKKIYPFTGVVNQGKLFLEKEGVRIWTSLELKGSIRFNSNMNLIGYGSFDECHLPCNVVFLDTPSYTPDFRAVSNGKFWLDKSKANYYSKKLPVGSLKIQRDNYYLDTPNSCLITFNGQAINHNSFEKWCSLEQQISKIQFSWL